MVGSSRKGLARLSVFAAMLVLALGQTPTVALATDPQTETPVAETKNVENSNVEAGSEVETAVEGPAPEAETTTIEAEPEAEADSQGGENDEGASETEGVSKDSPAGATAAVSRAGEYAYSGTNASSNKVYWVVEGESIDIPRSSEWDTDDNNGLLSKTEGTVWTASGLSYDGNGNAKVQKAELGTKTWWGRFNTEATVYIIPKTAVTKTFVLFDNVVPYTLASYESTAFGPGGDNSGYNVITVDIKKVIDAGGRPYVRVSDSGKLFVYFSFESDTGTNEGGTEEERKANANDYWEIIKKGISENDLSDLNGHFSSSKDYFGYALKLEGDPNGYWHIDGARNVTPPVYVVEVYENQKSQFLTSKDGRGTTGVDYSDFIARLKRYLDVEELTLTGSEDGKSATVTYEKDGVTYTRQLKPYDHPSNEEVGKNSAIHPADQTFGYGVSGEKYYLCQLMLTESVAQTGSLKLTKNVTGDVADVTKHYTFELSNVPNGTYDVRYEKIEPDATTHPAQITVSNQTYELTLKDDESATIEGLPARIKVSVKETGLSGNAGTSTQVIVNNGTPETVATAGGETDTSSSTVTIPNGGDPATVEYVNNADLQPTTGVSTSASGPMIGLLATAGAGIAALAYQRRRVKRGSDSDAWKE